MKKKLFASLIVISNLSFANLVYKPLTVHYLEEGDTFSDLLYKNNFKPLYGKTNWVNKILKLNNLTMEEAKHIKKGYPVMLPTREVTEVISEKKAAVVSSSKAGLFGGKVSEKINLNLEFGYFYQNIETKTENFDIQENYLLGININAKERYSLFNSWWGRPMSSLHYESQNTLALRERSDIGANFSPTLELTGGLLLDNDKIPFSLLTDFSYLEKSKIYEKNRNEMDVRRDRYGFMKLGIYKEVEQGKMVYSFAPYLGRTLWSQNTQNLKDNSYFELGLISKINLTEDAHLKAYYKNQSYDSDEVNSITGISLEYTIR